MSYLHAHDRFSLPGESTDAPLPQAGNRGGSAGTVDGGGAVSSDAGYGAPTPGRCSSGTPSVPREREGDDAWQARGLAHPAGRGWEAEPRRVIVEHSFPDGMPDDPVAASGHGQVLDAARQVRFLDHLANCGNVRVSAQRVSVSHETAYRLRRRDARFAALWDAALVHARARVAAVMGDRALEGTVEEVWFRGELVGHRRRYDSRLLLAHLARLDTLVAEQGEAAERAAWFDAELARLAGHPEPDGFEDAQGLWDDARHSDEDREADAPPPPPPTRREFVAWFSSRAIEDVPRKQEERVFAEAQEEAERLYTAWTDGCAARVDALIAGAGEGEGEGSEDGEAPSPLPQAGGAGGGPAPAPVEFKSALRTVSQVSHRALAASLIAAKACDKWRVAGGGKCCLYSAPDR